MRLFLFVVAFVFFSSSLAYAQRDLKDGGAITFDYNTPGQIIPKLKFTKDLAIFNPTTADTNKNQYTFVAATTLTRIWCSTDTGSVTIQFDERAEATPNTAGTNTMTSSLVCDTDTQATTSFSDATIAAEVPWNLQMTAVSGTPGVLRIHVSGTQ
jgi:hypothetical protein